MKLTKQDYLTILKFYNIDIDKNTKLNVIKETAETVLANKLCKCIKKVQDKMNKNDKDESRYIAICKRSVLNNKGIKATNFTCKNKAKFINKKGKKVILEKYKKFTNKKKI